MDFTGTDWMVLSLYMAAVGGIGWYFSRRNSSFEDFMFGGGQVPWLAVGISLIATSVSASTFLGNPADVYAHDMTYLMLNFGGLFAVLIAAWIFIPRFRREGVLSAYEILERRFGRRVRLLASVFYCAHLLLRTGILIYGPALVFSRIVRFDDGSHLDVRWAVLLTSLLAVVYTWFGGIRAVIWTDVLQFCVLMGGGLFVLSTLSDLSDGGMWALAAEQGKTRWFTLLGDSKGVEDLLADHRTFFSCGAIYIVFELAIRGCDQQFVQRYLSCRSTAAANGSSFLSVALGAVVGLVFFAIGAGLYVFYNQVAPGLLPEGTALNQIFPHFIVSQLPAGMSGLLVAAILAAAMSSLDSALTALSNTTVVDFLGRDPGPNGDALHSARIWILLWGVLGTAAALICASLEGTSLLSMALEFTSLFIGPLLGLFLMGFFAPWLRPRAVLWGTVLGMLCLIPFTGIPVRVVSWMNLLFGGSMAEAWTYTKPLTLAWQWNPVIALCAAFFWSLALHRFLPPALSEASDEG